MTRRETIGQRLRRLRLAVGLSQRKLAACTPYTAAYISRIEADQRLPSVWTLRALAVPLGVSALYLETGSDSACPHCGRDGDDRRSG